MGLHTNWHKTKIQNIGTGVAPRTVHIDIIALMYTVFHYNKNLAITNRSQVSCAHNTLRASIGLDIIP